MISSLWNWWKLDLIGAIGISVLQIFALTIAEQAIAQITPDTTLGAESSVVTPNVGIRGLPSDRIDGGAIRGANLFHSFQEFNLGEGRGVYFANPQGIENILSRVTGANRSEILGRLGVLGDANLFLINPNGIILGKNASLDIEGSFIGSTATSLKFADGTEFNSTSPQSKPLLSIKVPIGLQLGSNAGSISVEGSNLQVNPGRSLALVGGNVSMDGGKLVAPSGHVELGGAKAESTVELFANEDFFGLNFPPGVPQADVSLSNQAEVNVLSSSGGSIAINAGDLNMLGGSRLVTGISGIGLPNTQAGDIKVNATGRVAIADSSNIYNEVEQNAVGNSGNININADSLSLSNKSFLATSTNGQGNAGNLNITTGSLSVSDNSLLAANTNGKGNAGNITINAGDRISFDRGSAYTDVGENGKGQAGNFNIITQSLSLKNEARLIASTKNEGNAGNITINTGLLSVSDNSFLAASANGQQGDAGNITIDARDSVSFENRAKVYTDVNQFPVSDATQVEGDGGDINIKSESLSLTNGSQLISSTRGVGNAGNITIDTGLLSVTNESLLAASTNGQQGDAGNITIDARDRVLFDQAGQAYTNVTGRGNGGDISITTGSLSVLEGSFLAASANGQQGDAGNITVDARDTVSFGKGSRAYTDVTTKSNGGDINITTGSLFVTDDSFLASSTKGEGNSGNITINARDTILFDQGWAYTDVGENGEGQGGNFNIITRSLSLKNGAQLIASTKNEGNAGNITINTGLLSVSDKSFLAASANGIGNAGNITIDARDSVSFSKESQVYTDVTGRGNGGDISITTGSLSVFEGSFLAASANGQQGDAGNITVDARDTVSFDDSNITTATEQFSGGAIAIKAADIRLYSDSDITTNVGTGTGGGGDITLDANSILAFDDSDILAYAQDGKGGNITLNTPAFFGQNYKPARTDTDPSTLDGNNRVDINASGRVSGVITLPDTSFIQNSLSELPKNPIDSEALVASSCVVRSNERNGTFFITGKAGLPYHPGDAVPSVYSTVDVQSVPDYTSATKPAHRWKIGDPIVEPAGVYRLENGQRILSRECGK